MAGIHISQGRLAVYTLCAGLNPERVLAVALDVGTNRDSLLEDPLYPGLRRRRLQGDAYMAFVDEFVEAVRLECPGACLHWEDFGTAHAHELVERHRFRLPSFHDDIQGISGVASAAVLAACRGLKQSLAEQRIVIFGAGTAGCGIADGLTRLLRSEGLTEVEARARIWAIDRPGLLLAASPGLSKASARLAHDPVEVSGWPRDGQERFSLETVVERVRPTVLVGTSTVAGAFSQAVLEQMARYCHRPVILPLSNPNGRAAAQPADLLRWSARARGASQDRPVQQLCPVSRVGIRRSGGGTDHHQRRHDRRRSAGPGGPDSRQPRPGRPAHATAAGSGGPCGGARWTGQRAASPGQALTLLERARWQPVD